MTTDDNAILHFVDPIARFGDRRIVRDEEHGFSAVFHDLLQQLKGALPCRCGIMQLYRMP